MGEFDVVVADTPALRDVTFAVRHEVYCREFGYEPVRADGLERDAYDDRAHHYLLAHVPSGSWAGCVRVVPGPDLPYETVFAGVPVELPAVPRGEVSRLTIAREFRGGAGQHPSAMLTTAVIAVAAVLEAGIADAVCVMEPWLAARVNAVGICLSTASPRVQYRGLRALFHFDSARSLRDLVPELRDTLTAIRSTIAGTRNLGAAMSRQ